MESIHKNAQNQWVAMAVSAKRLLQVALGLMVAAAGLLLAGHADLAVIVFWASSCCAVAALIAATPPEPLPMPPGAPEADADLILHPAKPRKLWRESCAICGADVVLSPHYGHADRRRHPVDGRIRCFDHLGVDLPDHP